MRKAGGDLEGAIEDFDQAIEIDPRYFEAYINRGALYCDQLHDYDRAIEINPLYPEAYTNRGNIRRSRGDLPGAITDFEKALEVAPANWRYRKMVEGILAKARRALGEER